MATHGRPATEIEEKMALRNIELEDENEQLRDQLAAANERMEAAREFALFLADFMEITETKGEAIYFSPDGAVEADVIPVPHSTIKAATAWVAGDKAQ